MLCPVRGICVRGRVLSDCCHLRKLRNISEMKKYQLAARPILLSFYRFFLSEIFQVYRL